MAMVKPDWDGRFISTCEDCGKETGVGILSASKKALGKELCMHCALPKIPTPTVIKSR
jgi:hypothetical protein